MWSKQNRRGHIGRRLTEDKGARLVRYSKGSNQVCNRFFWHTPGADLWRLKLGSLCQMLQLTPDNYTDRMQDWYRPKWILKMGPIVESIKLREYPSFKALKLDYPEIREIPLEWLANPDFDLDTGPWPNPYREQARNTLFRPGWMRWTFATGESKESPFGGDSGRRRPLLQNN